jgi:energy-coupling factor transporter ATP-binding protein EcfA2
MIQILEIVLYSHDGRQRPLTFHPGELNIITGESQSGKSALVEILHYCFGSTTLRVPRGVIADSVAWYGLRLAAAEGQVFIGRPTPSPGRASSNAVMLLVANEVPAPDFADLEANTNTESLIDYLSRLVGIEDNEYVPPASSTRRPLEATIAHALFFNFQRQDEIANREFLFHRQVGEEGDFITQAIRDVLPYFLGAVEPGHVRMRGELRALRIELRRAESRLEKALAIREDQRDEANALVSEALEVGLIRAIEEAADLEALHLALRNAVDSSAGLDELSLASGTAFVELERRRSELAETYRTTKDQILLITSVLTEQTQFSTEVNEHVSRLHSVGLLPRDPAEHPTACPVCGQAAGDHLAQPHELIESLQALDRELNAVERDRPRLERVLAELQENAELVRGQIMETHAALESVAARDAEVEQLRERVNAQSYVRGRINHYLQNVEQTTNEAVEALRRSILQTRIRVDEAEGRLSAASVNENVTSILNVVGIDMAEWAQRLQLEYSDSPVRIDPSRLNVVADTTSGTIPLNRMGSAANWVGYHLVAYLALHKLFVERSRPVPRFVVFDQPTQAFYPPEAGDDAFASLDDADRRSVARMFELLRDVAQELAPELQIIVTDHANLDTEWFQAAIREEWRGGRKLVPADWIS